MIKPNDPYDISISANDLICETSILLDTIYPNKNWTFEKTLDFILKQYLSQDRIIDSQSVEILKLKTIMFAGNGKNRFKLNNKDLENN